MLCTITLEYSNTNQQLNKLIATLIAFLFTHTSWAQKTIIVDTLVYKASYLWGYELVDVPNDVVADKRPYITTALIERPGKYKFREVSTHARTAVITNITDDSIALKLDDYGSRIMLHGLHSIEADTIHINYFNTTAKTDSIIKGDIVYWYKYNDSMDMSSEWIKSLDKAPKKAQPDSKQINITINNKLYTITAVRDSTGPGIKSFHGYKLRKKHLRYQRAKDKLPKGKVYKYIYFHGEEYKWYYCYKAELHL